MLKIFVIFLFSIVVTIGLSAVAVDILYGGGEKFPDRTGPPTLPSNALEVVANLDFPPGNIAVSPEGRIFFTFHPEGRPPESVAELINGKPQAIQIQGENQIDLNTVLSMRIDQQNRLWLLDYGDHGQTTPQIVALDIDTFKVVHHFEFPDGIAGLGSHLNDFQVDQLGTRIYIADASVMGLDPALIVYDIRQKTARRLLTDHESVTADDYVPYVEGKKMLIFGVFAIRPGVDSIALDRREEWLYFAAPTDEKMYRIRVSDLNNPSLSSQELSNTVEAFGDKTMSDGITTDNAGNIYLSDLEHSAIVRMRPDASLETLIKDPALRWPDGFSFGPDGWLYVTASSLQSVIMLPSQYIAEQGPYQIFRFKTDSTARAGH